LGSENEDEKLSAEEQSADPRNKDGVPDFDPTRKSLEKDFAAAQQMEDEQNGPRPAVVLIKEEEEETELPRFGINPIPAYNHRQA